MKIPSYTRGGMGGTVQWHKMSHWGSRGSEIGQKVWRNILMGHSNNIKILNNDLISELPDSDDEEILTAELRMYKEPVDNSNG